MAPQNPKVIAAFEAMKALGIPQKKVKPVLKDLIQTYDKNWEMIEQENYRVLLDAIFDAEDNATEKKKKLNATEKKKELVKRVNEAMQEEPEEETERPLKRLRLRGREVNQSLNTPESPETREEGRQISLSPQNPKRNKGKQPMVSMESLTPIRSPVPGKGLVIYESQPRNGLSLIGPVTEAGKVLTINKIIATSPIVEPKDEPFTEDIAPANEKDIPADNGETGDFSTSLGERRTECEARPVQMEPCSSLVIATSPLGEVKLSLSCNSAVGNHKFLVPTLDAVIKMAEEKCIHSYKISDPNFSVTKLLTHICESFLELGTDSIHEPQDSPQSEQPSEPQDGLTNNHTHDSHQEPTHDCPPNEWNSSMRSLDVVEDIDSPNNQTSDSHHEPHVCPPDERNMSMRSLRIVKDIANGEESVSLPWINEINDECPALFRYISQGLVFQNAKLDVTLSAIGDKHCCSSCFEDCLSAPLPCACAQGTGGKFAYTLEGLVKEDFLEKCISSARDQCLIFCEKCPLEKAKNDYCLEPCKGHVEMNFIKECWKKCGCGRKCGNRIVQRGITSSLQVYFTSEERGWGLRTLEELPKGTFVCEYVGEILTTRECYERTLKCGKGRGNTYLALDADWGYKRNLKDEKALCLDASQYGNVARFINHRCLDANLVEIPVEVETPDHHYYHVAFFTTRKVKALEELTWDYGIDFDDEDYLIKPFVCRCGSKFCRNIKRVNRHKSTPTSS